MKEDIACFCEKKKNVAFKVINMSAYKMCYPFAVFISIRRINSYAICL